METKSILGLLLAPVLCVILSLAAEAKGSSKTAGSSVPGENMALVLGQAGEAYPIYGVGGIKVTGGHHGFWSTNLKSSAIQVDGSGIAVQKFVPVNVTADFSAAPSTAYFVSNSAICTLPTAVGCAGQEIVLCNAGANCTITYQVVPGEMLFGGEQPGAGEKEKAVSNARQGKVDRFISDGKGWYRE